MVYAKRTLLKANTEIQNYVTDKGDVYEKDGKLAQTQPRAPIKKMKPKIIGYERGGKFYGIATHLGGVYISTGDINIYYVNDKQLLKDFESAKLLVQGKPYVKGAKIKMDEEDMKNLGRGRLFISTVKNAKEFEITNKCPSDHTKTVALRAQFKLTNTREGI